VSNIVFQITENNYSEKLKNKYKNVVVGLELKGKKIFIVESLLLKLLIFQIMVVCLIFRQEFLV
jgi:hypothetical protein